MQNGLPLLFSIPASPICRSPIASCCAAAHAYCSKTLCPLEKSSPGEVVILILQHGEDLVYFLLAGAILHGVHPLHHALPDGEAGPGSVIGPTWAALISVTRPAAVVTYPEFESEVRSALQEGRFGARRDPDG